jgi:hypothetical protein
MKLLVNKDTKEIIKFGKNEDWADMPADLGNFEVLTVMDNADFKGVLPIYCLWDKATGTATINNSLILKEQEKIRTEEIIRVRGSEILRKMAIKELVSEGVLKTDVE